MLHVSHFVAILLAQVILCANHGSRTMGHGHKGHDLATTFSPTHISLGPANVSLGLVLSPLHCSLCFAVVSLCFTTNIYRLHGRSRRVLASRIHGWLVVIALSSVSILMAVLVEVLVVKLILVMMMAMMLLLLMGIAQERAESSGDNSSDQSHGWIEVCDL